VHAITKARAALTLANSSKPDDLPEGIEEFFDRCCKTNYGMTSAQNFDGRGVGIVVAIATEFAALAKRVKALEEQLEEAKASAEANAPRRVGRPPGSGKKAPQPQTAGV